MPKTKTEKAQKENNAKKKKTLRKRKTPKKGREIISQAGTL